jgi:catechol-2,3-dioxygenase
MEIEHIGITVAEPIKMAAWYKNNLGCTVLFHESDSNREVAFVADQHNHTILELIKQPSVDPTWSLLQSTSQLHIAFLSTSPYDELKRLEKEGASLVEDNSGIHECGILLLVKDPWGGVFQLVKRGNEMALK